MKQFCKNFDMFGTPVQFRFHDEATHKTTIGGIISFTINMLGYSYSFYMIISWLLGEFVPNIQDDQIQITSKKTMVYTYNPLQVSMESLVQNSTFIGYQAVNGTYSYKLGQMINLNSSTLQLYNQSNCGQDVQADICLKGSDDKTFDTNISQSLDEGSQSLVLYIYPCVQENCQNDQVFRIKFEVFIENYDITSKKIIRLKKSFAFLTTISQTFIIQFIARLQQITVNDDNLFPAQNTFQLINDVQIITAILTNVSQDSNGISRTLLHLDTIYNSKIISYVTFTEVLAQIGSVFSLLNFVQIFLLTYSQNHLDNYLSLDILKIYFPTLQKVNIDQDIFGKVKRIEGMSKDDLKQFLKTYQTIANKQMSVISILRHLKTLQGGMRHLLNQEYIQKFVHDGDNPFNIFQTFQLEEITSQLNYESKHSTLIELFQWDVGKTITSDQNDQRNKIHPISINQVNDSGNL